LVQNQKHELLNIEQCHQFGSSAGEFGFADESHICALEHQVAHAITLLTELQNFLGINDPQAAQDPMQERAHRSLARMDHEQGQVLPGPL
jgi:hypothetical protein